MSSPLTTPARDSAKISARGREVASLPWVGKPILPELWTTPQYSEITSLSPRNLAQPREEPRALRGVRDDVSAEAPEALVAATERTPLPIVVLWKEFCH